MPLWLDLLIRVVAVVVAFLVLPLVVGQAEHKVMAHMQGRLGPMYAGAFHGWAQLIADGVKFAQKEDVVPAAADRGVFRLAPAVALVPYLVAMSAIPLSATWVAADVDAGLLFVLAASAVGVLGTGITVGVMKYNSSGKVETTSVRVETVARGDLPRHLLVDVDEGPGDPAHEVRRDPAHRGEGGFSSLPDAAALRLRALRPASTLHPWDRPAARAALALGASVKVFDNSVYRLKRLQNNIGQRMWTSVMEPRILSKQLKTCEVAVGALGSQSAAAHGLRSIMVAPLQLKGRLLGVVYLDSRIARGITARAALEAL